MLGGQTGFASTILGCRGQLPAMNLERRSKLVEEQVGVGVGNTTLVSVRNTRPKGAVSALMVFPQEMPDQLAVWLQMRFASRLGKDLGEPGGTAWRFRTARWIVPPEAQRVLGNPRGQDWAGSASLGPDLVGSITDQPGGARWCHASVK